MSSFEKYVRGWCYVASDLVTWLLIVEVKSFRQCGQWMSKKCATMPAQPAVTRGASALSAGHLNTSTQTATRWLDQRTAGAGAGPAAGPGAQHGSGGPTGSFHRAAPQPEAAAQVEACEALCQVPGHQDMQLCLRPRPTCNLYQVFWQLRPASKLLLAAWHLLDFATPSWLPRW